MTPRLILFTRFPTPGEAKTRLIPMLGAKGAAELHRVLTERTVEVLRTFGAPVEVHVTGASAQAFQNWLGNELTIIPQAEGGLGERLLAALDPAPCIFFGADTPDLSPEIVAEAVAALETHDGVIGPAEDGGYYLIGMSTPQPALFTDMAWSMDTVFAETMRRVGMLNRPALQPTRSSRAQSRDVSAGHSVSTKLDTNGLEEHQTVGLNFLVLEPLSDCDRPEDLARWPWLAT